MFGKKWGAVCLLLSRRASLAPSLLNNVFDWLKQFAWFPAGVCIKPVGPSEIQSFSQVLCSPSPPPVPCVTRFHQTNAVALVRDGTAEQTRRFTTILLSNFSNSLYLRELWLVLETTRTLPLWLLVSQAIRLENTRQGWDVKEKFPQRFQSLLASNLTNPLKGMAESILSLRVARVEFYAYIWGTNLTLLCVQNAGNAKTSNETSKMVSKEDFFVYQDFKRFTWTSLFVWYRESSSKVCIYIPDQIHNATAWLKQSIPNWWGPEYPTFRELIFGLHIPY